jgi:hypothetical protein
MADWRPPYHTQEKAESEKVRYGGLCASRPLPHKHSSRAEKVKGYDSCQTPPHTREGREREGEGMTGASRPLPHTEKAESEKVRYG